MPPRMSIDQSNSFGRTGITPEDKYARIMIDLPDGTIIRIDEADVELRTDYMTGMYPVVEFRLNPIGGRYVMYEPGYEPLMAAL